MLKNYHLSFHAVGGFLGAGQGRWATFLILCSGAILPAEEVDEKGQKEEVEEEAEYKQGHLEIKAYTVRKGLWWEST